MKADNRHFMSSVGLLDAKRSIELGIEHLENDLPTATASTIRSAITKLVGVLERIAINK